jgi:hypothetical protein
VIQRGVGAIKRASSVVYTVIKTSMIVAIYQRFLFVLKKALMDRPKRRRARADTASTIV